MDFRNLAKTASEKQTIVPKLKLGEEPQTGTIRVQFEQPTFNEAVNPNPIPGRPAEFFTIQVRVLADSDFGDEAGVLRSIAGSAGSSLGDELLRIWAANGENLLGVQAEIEVYNYSHKKLKKNVRGYRITKTKNPA